MTFVSLSGFCAEDHEDVKGVTCTPDPENCIEAQNGGKIRRCLAQNEGCPVGKTVFKAHGPLTGYCIPSDR